MFELICRVMAAISYGMTLVGFCGVLFIIARLFRVGYELLTRDN